MDPNIVLHKTEKGIVEIKTRQYKLASKYRLILILIDGQSKVELIREKVSRLPDLDKYLLALLKAGFISTTSVKLTAATSADKEDKPISAKKILIEYIISILGEKYADQINQRFQPIANNQEDLERALIEYCRLVTFTIDEKKSKTIAKEGKKILSI